MGIFDFFKKKATQENFNSNIPKILLDLALSQIKSNPQACNSDEISQGIGEFGLVSTNPVPVRGIPYNEYYLNRLRTPDGKKLNYRRNGSMDAANINMPIDEYEIYNATGDGVNDAPALAQADVGIAVGSGSDIAAETAGIVLVNSNPIDVVNLILFGKSTYSKMIQNLVWATGYNVVALPLAAGVLYNWGIFLSPAAGAVLMTLSTVIVAINASMLKVKK